MTAGLYVPCLPGCDYASCRADDDADRTGSGHSCQITVDYIETLRDASPVIVQVIRWVGPNGETEPANVEIIRADGRQLDDGFTAAGALALAAALTRAADIIRATR
jgi:hypothetical protein